jgi:hypothetical protein
MSDVARLAARIRPYVSFSAGGMHVDVRKWLSHTYKDQTMNENDAAAEILSKRIGQLVEICGSMQAVAKDFDIDCGYLSRLASGKKKNPSDLVLGKLGLERVVTYRLIPKVYVATPLTPRTKSA